MIKTFIKEHWLILLFAFLLTLIIKSPLLAFPFVAGDAYRGINIYHHANMAVDEDFYLSRGKEVLEGHALGNPLIREGKDTNPDYYFNITEQVLVKPFYLLGLADVVNIATLYTIYNSIGVFVLILLLYFFALEFRPDKLFAVTVAVFVISGYALLDYRAFFLPAFNIYGRSLTPYISSLAFFSYALLCVRALKAPSLHRSFFAGAVFGALAYLYSYAWTFALIFNGFLFLMYAVKRDWRLVKYIVFISSLGIVIGAYNIARAALFFSSPAGQQFSYFYNAVYGHALAYRKAGPFLLILFGIFAYRNRTDESCPILYALLFAGWFSINQQFITGVSIQPNHYLTYFAFPALIIVFSYLFYSLAPNRNVRMIGCSFLIFVFLFNTGVEQYGAFSNTLGERLHEQNYQPALGTLRAAPRPGVVLAADDDPELLITVYTPHDLFWQRNLARFNNNPLERHKDALLLYLYLNREARANPRAYLSRILQENTPPSFYQAIYQDIEGYLSGFAMNEYYLRLNQRDEKVLQHRQRLLDSLVREYDSLVKDPNCFENLLTRYGVNWVLWDMTRQPEWDVSVLRGLREVVSSQGVLLFERTP